MEYGKTKKEILISNLNGVCLGIILLMIFLMRFVGKGRKYFDVFFFLLLGLFFIIYFYLRKEALIMRIIKENKNLKKEELMRYDFAFLEKVFYLIKKKKEEEMENKILENIKKGDK